MSSKDPAESTGSFKNIMITKSRDKFVLTHYKHNFLVNILDGGFFGFAMGFASFSTIITLFVAKFSNSAILFGLIPAIHSMGWQLPQLLTAQRISQMPRVKSFVLWMTTQERLPIFGLGILALLVPFIHTNLALVITFILLIWQGLGSGITANAWQILVGKIIPARSRGTFFGTQSAAANLLMSIGAIIAGYILEKNSTNTGFAICFFIACIFMIFSWISLSKTKEPEYVPHEDSLDRKKFWQSVRDILKNDKPFLGFLISRALFQLGMMSFAFFIIYGVRFIHMSVATAGIMTGILSFTMVIVNPILGWVADHWSHRRVFELGAIAAGLASFIILVAPTEGWFVLIMILNGIAGTAFWTIGMVYTLEFGDDHSRPTYVGMSNTLGAPIAILAPIIGGVLADHAGYSATFIVSIVLSLITAVVLHFFVSPRQNVNTL
jgi:MFS family permease